MERQNEKNSRVGRLLIPGFAISLTLLASIYECGNDNAGGQVKESSSFKFCPNSNVCGELLTGDKKGNADELNTKAEPTKVNPMWRD